MIGLNDIREIDKAEWTLLVLVAALSLLGAISVVIWPEWLPNEWQSALPLIATAGMALGVLLGRPLQVWRDRRSLCRRLAGLDKNDKRVLGYAVLSRSPWVLVPAIPRELYRLYGSGLLSFEAVSESPEEGYRLVTLPPAVWRQIEHDRSFMEAGQYVGEVLEYVDTMHTSTLEFKAKVAQFAQKAGLRSIDCDRLAK